MDTQKDPEMCENTNTSLFFVSDRKLLTFTCCYRQHLRKNDRRLDRLLGHVYALCPRRYAQELPALPLPCDQL